MEVLDLPNQSGEAVGGDDGQRGADGSFHFQSRKEHQRGQDDDAPAHAEEPGKETDGQPSQQAGQAVASRGGLGGPTEHAPPGHQQERAKGQEQHPSGNQVRNTPAEPGAGNATGCKQEGHPQIQGAPLPIQEAAEEARASDDDERHAYGLVAGNMRDIDQHRQRDDGAAAAQEAQRQTDEDHERGCQKHLPTAY